MLKHYSALVYASQNVTYALEKTSMGKLEALCGLLPLVFFFTEALIVFTTEWGKKYPALAVLLLMPSYCLMTCRHIICSVTRMIFDWKQLNPLWFLLFIANKAFIPLIRNHYVSLYSFSCFESIPSRGCRWEWPVARELGGRHSIFCNIHSFHEVHRRDYSIDYFLPRHQLPDHQEEGSLNHWDGRLGIE